MIEFIAHTAPDDKNASKNQEYQELTPSNSCTGENTKSDKNQPQWNPKHIIQEVIPSKNFPIG